MLRVIGGLLVSLLFGLAYAEPSSSGQPDVLVQKALALNLHNSPVWHALLHVDHGRSHIEDLQFLLSLPKFSVQEELTLSIRQLFEASTAPSAQCRFPARDAWLRSRLELPVVSYSQCREFQEFLDKAPADTISLVYASENIAQASSMMGHILLKLAGRNQDGKEVEHAVSFYTEIKGFNLPKIMYDSLVVGKKGYFALSPFSEKKDYYALKEQRNVWIYDLELSDNARQLIHWHLWELHQTQLRYFFHSYNCATFTQFILAIFGNPGLMQSEDWASPLDVVKRVNQIGMVAKTRMHPASRARVRMFGGAHSNVWKGKVRQGVIRQDPAALPASHSAEERFITLKTGQAYADYLVETGDLTQPEWQAASSMLNRQLAELPATYAIDVSDYKSPLLAPGDNQWYGGVVHVGQRDYLRLGVLPAAHRLEDDNRQSMSENELRLGDTSVLIDAKKQTLRLEQFQLYAMASYVPFESLTGGISGRFSIGYGPQYDGQLVRYKAATVSGAMGLSVQADPDMLVYALLSAGFAYGKHRLQQYAAPELGLIVNEVYGMKSIVNVGTNYFSTGSADRVHMAKVTQAIPLDGSHRLVFSYGDHWRGSSHRRQAELMLKWLW